MEYFKCDYADERCKRGKKDGWCKRKQVYCNGNGYFEFDDIPIPIKNNDVCKEGSIFGNFAIKLTKENIETLKNGGTVALLHNEYNIFIRFDDDLINEKEG